jgi:hypothetical protein
MFKKFATATHLLLLAACLASGIIVCTACAQSADGKEKPAASAERPVVASSWVRPVWRLARLAWSLYSSGRPRAIGRTRGKRRHAVLWI